MPRNSGHAARGFLLALGLVLAGVVAGPALDAGAIGGINTVAVSPAHGRVATSFQATYSISPCQNASGLTIGFSWNAVPPGGAALGSAVTDATCRATVTARPPANTAPGNYVVYGFVQLPTGDATPNTEASAAYTVDVTPTATATATVTPRATATARPTTTATASVGASTPVNATSSALTPAASSQPQPSATGGSTSGSASGGSKQSQAWWTTLGGILAIIGGLLAVALLLAVLFLFVLLPAMRRRSRSVSMTGRDRAA